MNSNLTSAMLLLWAAAAAPGPPPAVSNVRISARPGLKLVDIRYDLEYSGGNTMAVGVLVSTDNGATYTLPASSFTGEGYGGGVSPGSDKRIVWNAAADWSGTYSSRVRFQVLAHEVPQAMAFIPAGPFDMGDVLHEGNANESPVHQVFVSAFYMDRYDVTKSMWDDVYAWAVRHGYAFENAGSAKAPNHPVETVNWYDAARWCNARSEKEGLAPAYYSDEKHTVVYRSGQADMTNSQVDWAADGYRLPTEAEWEKAARGGATGHRFPWSDSDTISHSRANYYSSDRNSYDVSPTRGYNPAFHDGVYPFTSPVGYFPPNGYGLYDMAGNLWQWCWDWYDVAWYANPAASVNDTHGPDSGPKNAFRVMRGGAWHRAANFARWAHRGMDAPDLGWIVFGFRCARRF
jgi:formylglycine-generating enzyme required for sulfatase activity